MTNWLPPFTALIALGGAPLFAQDPPAPQPLPPPEETQEEAPEGELQPPDVPDLPVVNDPQAEMEALFAEVELRLRRIDLMLSDAAAGDASLASVEDAGLDDLLKEAQSEAGSAVDDINRILQLAQQSGPQSSSPSGGQPPPDPSGQSPLDEQQQGQQQTPEQTPSTPQPQGQEEQQEGSEGEQPEEQPGGEHPEDGETETEEEPRNRAGSEQDDSRGTPPGDRDSNNDGWGDLPQHVRQVFRAEGSDDLPVQYRDWIDSYYRRLNRKR